MTVYVVPHHHVIVDGRETLIYQDTNSGQFFTRSQYGNFPVNYEQIDQQTLPFPMKLRYWRCRYGYNQQDMARMMNIKHFRAYSAWEQGTRNPNKDNLHRLNTILGGHLQ